MRRVLFAGALGFLVAGCGSVEIGKVYRAERDFYRAERLSRRLSVNPDATSDADKRRIAEAYGAVGDTYKERLAVRDTTDASRLQLARVSSRAHLMSCQYYLELRDFAEALRVAESVRDYMSWSPITAMVAQARVVEALAGQEKSAEAVTELWKLASDYPPTTATGEVYHPAFNAAMNAVALTREIGDSLAFRAAAMRALTRYEEIGGAWHHRLPGLLADLHRATLLSELGRWRDATAILRGVLEEYPETVLQPTEAANVAFRLAQLSIRDDRDVPTAVAYFERARKLDPKGEAACDATLELAGLAVRRGRIEDAVAFYEDAGKRRPDDSQRVAASMFGLAQVLEHAGRWDEAVSEYRAVQATYPHSPQALEVPFVIAAHYRESRAEDLALSALRRAEEELRTLIHDRPGSAEAFGAYPYLARSLLEQREWSAAVDVMSDFASSFPTAPEGAMALLEAAQVCRQHLADDARLAALLKRVEEGYPNTEFAEMAARERTS